MSAKNLICGGLFYLGAIILTVLVLASSSNSQIITADVSSDEEEGILFKPAEGFDRTRYFLNPGKIHTSIRSYAYWSSNLSPYTRHGTWGAIYRVYPFVGMPPGPWGANIPHESGREPDRTSYYNVLDQQSIRYANAGGTLTTDWEADDLARFRTTASVSNEWGSPPMPSSNKPDNWPRGYYGEFRKFSGTGKWTPTPGAQLWPGRWAVETDPFSPDFGKPQWGEFNSDADVYFRSIDKYAGIRFGDDVNVSYPVGLDFEQFVYAYSSPLLEDMIVWNVDLIFRTEASVREQELFDGNHTPRRLYNGTIDGMYWGFTVDLRFPRYFIGPDAINGRGRPYSTDTYLMWEDDFDALQIYHKYGYHAAQWGNLDRKGPTSVYSYMFTKTPKNLGITFLHYYNGRNIYGSQSPGPEYEKRLYGLMDGDPTLVPEEEWDFWFHTYPGDTGYPDYRWDNLDSMRRFNDYDGNGNKLINKFDIQTNEENDTKPQTFFMLGSGPFSMSPGDTVRLHFVVMGSDDNPGPLDPDNDLWPNNDPTQYDVDPRDRFSDVYVNLETAVKLKDNFYFDITKDERFIPPEQFNLFQNFPNPFNPATNIFYDIRTAGQVKMTVYNILGQEIRTLVNREQQAGRYKVEWDGTNDLGVSVSAGIYIYRLQVNGFIESKKMVLIK